MRYERDRPGESCCREAMKVLQAPKLRRADAGPDAGRPDSAGRRRPGPSRAARDRNEANSDRSHSGRERSASDPKQATGDPGKLHTWHALRPTDEDEGSRMARGRPSAGLRHNPRRRNEANFEPAPRRPGVRAVAHRVAQHVVNPGRVPRSRVGPGGRPATQGNPGSGRWLGVPKGGASAPVTGGSPFQARDPSYPRPTQGCTPHFHGRPPGLATRIKSGSCVHP